VSSKAYIGLNSDYFKNTGARPGNVAAYKKDLGIGKIMQKRL